MEKKQPMQSIENKSESKELSLLKNAKFYNYIGQHKNAFPIFSRLAENGDPQAQRFMGLYYEMGWEGVRKNYKKALDWYLKAATQDDNVNLDKICLTKKIQRKSKKSSFSDWFVNLILQNRDLNGRKTFYLNIFGQWYFYGFHFEKDYQKAYDCFIRALDLSKQGREKAGAAIWLAHLLKEEEKYEEAFMFYVVALENGCKEALVSIGKAYQEGLGVEANNDKAFEFFEKAYEEGLQGASIWLADAYYSGWGTDVDYAKAIKLYEEGMSDSVLSTLAMCCVAEMVEKGQGCERDWKRAYDLYAKAVEQGDYLQGLEPLSRYYDKGREMENEAELRKCLNRILETSDDEEVLERTKKRLEELNK